MEDLRQKITNNIAKGNERSLKYKVLKLKRLLKFVVENKTEPFNDNIELLNVLNSIKSIDLLEFGSDFFWSYIHIITAQIENNSKKNFIERSSYLLINIFDSFYNFLPNGSTLKISINQEIQIILPKLKISFKYFPCKGFHITKENQDYFAFEIYNSGENLLKLKQPIKNQTIGLKNYRIINQTYLILEKSYTIYEDHYFHNCSENFSLSCILGQKIREAIQFIKETDFQLFTYITSNLETIVPFGNYIDRKYPNFAIATLKKTIFLSIELINDPIYLIAECIIHEFGHCELHSVQDTILLTNIDNEILEKYSPWRKDPRHLLGIIHGIYISYKLICFYKKFLLRVDAKYYKIEVYNQTTLIIHQIILASKQIKIGELTDFTKDLLDNILSITNIIAVELKIDLFLRPKEITDHINEWKITNSKYIIIE